MYLMNNRKCAREVKLYFRAVVLKRGAAETKAIGVPRRQFLSFMSTYIKSVAIGASKLFYNIGKVPWIRKCWETLFREVVIIFLEFLFSRKSFSISSAVAIHPSSTSLLLSLCKLKKKYCSRSQSLKRNIIL